MKTEREAASPRAAEANFAALAAAFERASAGRAARVAHCELGGRAVRFRIAGAVLAEVLLEPVRHLLCDSPPRNSDLGLEVDVWDGAATGTHCAGCVVLADLADARPHLGIAANGQVLSYRRADNLVMFDRAARRIVGWFADGTTAAFHERARPLSGPLVLWCHDQGVQVVHAALVAHRNAGVLIGGPGGSGKTTCALSCLKAGFGYLGDDCVGLRADGAAVFTGYSLYASAYAEPDHLSRFDGLLHYAIADASGREAKRMIPLARVPHASLARSTPVRAVIVPRVADSNTTSYRSVPRGEAFRRLAPSSLFALPHVRTERLDILADLVERMPCFRLDLGRDVGEIPQRILEILREIGAS